MASASSLEQKMAELEDSFIVDAPANILRFGIVEKISMQLSMIGALVSWKNVADELGFSNLEISGHYANFAGSECALRMLNDWIFKRNGKIRDLVRVFLTLELYGCLEDLKEDLEKYAQQSKKSPDEDKDDEGIDSSRNDSVFNSTISSSSTPSSLVTRESFSGPGSYPKDSSFCSSGLDSLSTNAVSSLESSGSSAMTSMQSDLVDSLPCPYTSIELSTASGSSSSNTTAHPSVESSVTSSSNHKSTSKTSTTCSENSPKNNTQPSLQPQRSVSVSLIKEVDWPLNPDYKRSTSVPHENIHKTKTKTKRTSIFKRSKSLEPATEIHKRKFPSFPRFKLIKKGKKKNKVKNEKTTDTENDKAKNKVEVDNGVTSATATGFYCEKPSTLKPNLSPLIVSEEKAQRPVSSGSEDSLPFSPNSPTSPMGYESGYHSGDNSCKRIYIVCCPEEEEIYQRALKMYRQFSQKGYECHLFATDTREVMEIGRFRYEMQQVKDADFVFLCVSRKLKDIFEVPVHKAQALKDDDSKRLRHVSDFMINFFANDCCNKNGKFMTILLMKDSDNYIPFVMNSYLKYKWPEQERRMENTIHQRSEIQLPVSDAKIYAPIKFCTPEGVVKASVREDDTKG